MSRFQRITSWSLLLCTILGLGGAVFAELNRYSRSLQIEVESAALDLQVAQRKIAKLASLEAQLQDEGAKPNTSPYWTADTPSDGLLDFQEFVTKQAQNADLTVTRVEPLPTVSGSPAIIALRLSGEGRMQELQQVLFSWERQEPRIAVYGMTIKPRTEPELLDFSLELRAAVQQPE